MNNFREEAIYLYCIARSDELKDISGKALDNEHELYLVNCSDIAALCSNVYLDEFTGLDAEEKLKDINWIGPRAFSHEHIIEQAANFSSVLPSRFGTLFSSIEKLQVFLTENHKMLIQTLDRMKNKNEWAVKLYLNKKQLINNIAEQKIQEDKQKLEMLSPGKRYFEEKRIFKDAEKVLKKHINAIFNKIMNMLETCTEDLFKRRPLSKEATGKTEDMVLNLAVLLVNKKTSEFGQNIDNIKKEISKQGFNIEITGPFPPYSFCPSISAENKG